MKTKQTPLSFEEAAELVCHEMKFRKILMNHHRKDIFMSNMRETLGAVYTNATIGMSEAYSNISDKKHDRGARDHVVPVNLIIKMLIEMDEDGTLSPANIAKDILPLVKVVRITNEEHERLEKLGLKSSMPKDWDGKDVFARYAVAGIKVID